eukprot:403372585
MSEILTQVLNLNEAATTVQDVSQEQKYFAYTMMMLTLIGLECFMMMPLIVGKARRKTFTASFMDQFMENHRRELSSTDEGINEPILPPVGGYPDAGSGRFSEKLAYKDWYEFNNAQRVHLNFIEQLPLILTLILIVAMKDSLASLIISIVYFVARLTYTVGYLIGGPNYRAVGALTILALLVISFGYGFYASAEMIKFLNYTVVSSTTNSASTTTDASAATPATE